MGDRPANIVTVLCTALVMMMGPYACKHIGIAETSPRFTNPLKNVLPFLHPPVSPFWEDSSSLSRLLLPGFWSLLIRILIQNDSLKTQSCYWIHWPAHLPAHLLVRFLNGCLTPRRSDWTLLRLND